MPDEPQSGPQTPVPAIGQTAAAEAAPDLLHRFLNWVSYNRYTALAAIVAVAAVTLAGCQFKAADPVTGQRMTAQELQDAQAKQHAAAIVDQARAQKDFDSAGKAAKAAFDKALQDAGDKFDIGTQERSNRIADADRAYTTAQDDIARKNAMVGGVLNLVQTALSAAPPSLLGGFALGGVALALGQFGDRKRKDAVIARLSAA